MCLPRQPFDILLPIPTSVSITLPKHMHRVDSRNHLSAYPVSCPLPVCIGSSRVLIYIKQLTFPVLIIKISGKGKLIQKQDPSLFLPRDLPSRNRGMELGRRVDITVCSFGEAESCWLGQVRKYGTTHRLQSLRKS